jgi:molybdenum cofactor cytidylyltransferase
MIVVLGHISDFVVAALGDRSFHRLAANPDAPMFESIRAGLQAALRIDSSATVVLQPCDHPEVASSTLRTIVEESIERPDQAIIPQFAGRGGHPVLIPASVGVQLTNAACPHGLGQFWLDHPHLCRRVAIDDATVVRDIDTPADLE